MPLSALEFDTEVEVEGLCRSGLLAGELAHDLVGVEVREKDAPS